MSWDKVLHSDVGYEKTKPVRVIFALILAVIILGLIGWMNTFNKEQKQREFQQEIQQLEHEIQVRNQLLQLNILQLDSLSPDRRLVWCKENVKDIFGQNVSAEDASRKCDQVHDNWPVARKLLEERVISPSPQ